MAITHGHDFDGATYDPRLDRARLNRQTEAVLRFMSDGRWHTLPEAHEALGEPEASISARLRDLRKARFGAYVVERRRRSPGLFEYRLEQRRPAPEPIVRASLDPRDYPAALAAASEGNGRPEPSYATTDEPERPAPEPPATETTFKDLDRLRQSPGRRLPTCPKTGCDEQVGDLVPTVATGYWRGKCPTHKAVIVQW